MIRRAIAIKNENRCTPRKNTRFRSRTLDTRLCRDTRPRQLNTGAGPLSDGRWRRIQRFLGVISSPMFISATRPRIGESVYAFLIDLPERTGGLSVHDVLEYVVWILPLLREEDDGDVRGTANRRLIRSRAVSARIFRQCGCRQWGWKRSRTVVDNFNRGGIYPHRPLNPYCRPWVAVIPCTSSGRRERCASVATPTVPRFKSAAPLENSLAITRRVGVIAWYVR